jgi:TolB-like protein/cytochrome c-type biogenesis protein CcmH/NrfG
VQAILRLYREARRRKVFRTGALYVLGAWLMLQVADVLFPGFGIPDAAIQALVWAAVLGFPLALAFGWLYEVGPGGIRRTVPADAGALPEPQSLARRDYLILAAFAAIAAMLVVRAVQEVRETPLAESPEAARDAGERLANSIAVLPFANISNDPENDYFCDGVSEEILDRLAGFRELNVIGRTSSFAFKGSDYGVDRISALLGVRYVLQGSVRKAGDQLRVSAQLLDQGGRQVWNQSFDRQLKNIFEIQSEIAGAVATTVASQVTAQPDTGHQPSLEAYEHYLTGRALVHRRDSGARAELERAVEIDPEFAEAHAELAIARAMDMDDTEWDRAPQSVERALQLEPRLLRARAAQGFLLGHGNPPDPAGAERVLREVLAQDPNMSDALNWLYQALASQGRGDEARAILERAVLIDPLHPAIAGNLAGELIAEGQTERAQEILERLLAQPTPSPIAYFAVSELYRSTGRLIEMNASVKSLALLEPSFLSVFFLMLNYALLGDWPQAEAINTRLMRMPPQGPGRIFRRLMLPGWQGQTDVAVRRLRETLKELELTLADLSPHERIHTGVPFARGGDYTAAIEALQPVVDVDSPGGSVTPISRVHGGHALAWSYLHTGADAQAARLLEAEARECASERAEGKLGDSYDLHRCAETELLRGNLDQALAGLEQAVEAGWRDYYLRERDPYWVTVANDPRYRALMAKVKADVDRQRAAVRRADAAEGFLVKLDAALAQQAGPK